MANMVISYQHEGQYDRGEVRRGVITAPMTAAKNLIVAIVK